MKLRHYPFVLFIALAASGLAIPASAQSPTVRADSIASSIGLSLGESTNLLAKDHECVGHVIRCGQTVSDSLTTHDCLDDGGFFFDAYFFTGQNGQTVTVTQNSAVIDSYLLLFDPEADLYAFNDNGGSGTNARMLATLDETSPEWVILPSSSDPGETGPYTLSLQCSGDNPPPPPPPPPPNCPTGFFGDSGYPDFCFKVTIGEPGNTRAGVREADCQPETVCVSGAVPGRSELFLRIIGPRPNGFLWPTIVRFTPSRVVVDIQQRSTMQVNTYTLDAVPPGTDELPGLQDRAGFLP